MQPRRTLLNAFSTFAQFSSDRFDSWIVDARLAQNMRRQLSQSDDYAESALQNINNPTDPLDRQQEAFWALYWYSRWQLNQRSIVLSHLFAYLQEPCYWAAENVMRRFISVNFSLADGFQIAIAHTPRILAGYQPTYGSNLKSYARISYSNVIRDQLRQQKAADICSDWGLLRKLSQTRLKQSLLAAGFTNIEPHILVWKCFKAICIPTGDRIAQKTARSLSNPNLESLTQIADRYNQLRTHLNPVPCTTDTKAVLESLKLSVRSARSYLNPSVTSLNQPQYEAGTELLNTLGVANSTGEGKTPLSQLIVAETEAQQHRNRQQIETVLKTAILSFEPLERSLLQYYYQDQLTQKDIATQLQMKQYQVSRRLSRLRQSLLMAVAQWSQESLHISLDSTVLANMSEIVHEWLHHYYYPTEPPADSLSGANLSETSEALK